MRASAYILIQRYLDGDLSEVELEAFLHDLEHDSELASMLEREVNIDASIINDAFAIQPPAQLRTAVLASMQAQSQAVPHVNLIVSSLAVSAIFVVLLMLPALYSTNVVRVESTARAEVQTAQPLDQISRPSLRTARFITSDVDEDRSPDETLVKSEIEITDVQRVNDEIPDVHPNQATSTLQWPLALPSTADMSNVLSGVVSPSIVALRYELDQFDNISVFVEAGALQQREIVTTYVNNVQMTSMGTALMPYASVGIGGELWELPFVSRSISGMAALGVTPAGPLVAADLTMNLLRVGSLSFDVGVRCIGSMNLRQQQSFTASVSPILRLALPLNTQ